jgi:hypothetical protein
VAKRNLEEVIDRVLAVIPKHEVLLRKTLEKAKEDAYWKPPEGHGRYWEAGAQAFYTRFGEEPPADGWGKRALAIWLGQEEKDEALGGTVIESQEPPPSVSLLARVRGFLGM